MTEHTQEELKKLWFEEFCGTPINNCDQIEEPFLHFEVDTDRFEIWAWFDERLTNGLVKDFMPELAQGHR